MKNILIRGPLLSNSGYGNHSRQIFSYLNNISNINLCAEILNWGDVCWIINKDYEEKIIEKIITCSNKEKPAQWDEVYQICLPNEWTGYETKYNCGITAGVESDICKKEWLSNINRMDKVIVPSSFTKNCFLNTFKKHKIKNKTKLSVIPEYYYSCFDSKILKYDFLNKIETKNNFLIIGQLTEIDKDIDRKNIFNLIEDIIEILSNVEDSGIILKTNLSKNSFSDFYRLKNIIKDYKESLSIRYKKMPKIYLLHGDLTQKELQFLYSSKKIKAMVSGTRGEGFGLPFLEAAACGLPIVATNYSAYTEFLEDFYKVDYSLVKRKNKNNEIFPKDCLWAEYKKKSLKENIFSLLNNEKNLNNLKKEILSKYNKNKVFSILDKKLRKV